LLPLGGPRAAEADVLQALTELVVASDLIQVFLEAEHAQHPH
jgi:hypothetical protein